MPNLIEAVRQLRERLGDTQQAFATRLGLSISAITNYERERIPSGRSLVQMMHVSDAHEHADLAQIFQDELSEQLGYRVPRQGVSGTVDLLPGEEARINALLAIMRGGNRFIEKLSEIDRLLEPMIAKNPSKGQGGFHDSGQSSEKQPRGGRRRK